ncbi:T9SS type A sorting domain-containing protein [Parabacteroides provencensis]|uniref:T9SS type A sorting domain-containing protein n=1 Tax=Parabacteroides provencensis TaxID=1944636 RepID=UPI000C145D64|nr:T9SS type A sorting domain-containing protein [Parabacteroides provencensis]
MIKNSLRAIMYVSLCLLMVNFPLHLQSQIPVPGQWNNFVQDVSQNISVRDTFLFQSFENDLSDTWNYTKTENINRIDVFSLYGIKGQGGKYSLKMPPASQVTFASFEQSPLYTDIRINATFAAKELSKGDKLFVKAERNGKTDQWEWCRSGSDKYTFPYRTLATLPYKLGNPVQIPGNPSDIVLFTPDTNCGNCYCIDSVYAFGLIPQYSLFTDKGDWSDEDLWTHLPALRHRSALVNGDVSILSDVQCKDLAVGNGSVYIAKDASLAVSNLILYSSDKDAKVDVDGHLIVRKQVAIEKTFKEKGKWYFLSFPFDVYLAGIEPDFELKDDAPNDGGNYFYVCCYNGDRRASLGRSNDNWEVLKVDNVSGSQPVFEKNKGYLIALDSKASNQTLRFSSAIGKLPSDFGKSMSVPVKATLDGIKDEDNGWYLCGNPLPSLLPLKAIESNPLLDGYVYVYERGDYKPYPIGSNYALPPFAAFFVKTQADTELVINNQSGSDNCVLLSMPDPLSSINLEPGNKTTPLHTGADFNQRNIISYMDGDRLILENIPDKGNIRIMDLAGKVVLQKKIGKGCSSINLPLCPGLYILKIEMECYCACHKIVKAG